MSPKLYACPAEEHKVVGLSRQKVAELLDMTDDSVHFLQKSGYLPDLDVRRIATLSNYPYLYSDGDYPVLQQALGAPSSPTRYLERFKIGESATHTDPECVLANQGEWAGFRDADVLAVRFLPVTLRKFTVSVLRVTGILGVDGNRTTYKADLAGRVRELGRPDLDYVNPDLSGAERETVKLLLGSRSTSNVPGPCGKLKAI